MTVATAIRERTERAVERRRSRTSMFPLLVAMPPVVLGWIILQEARSVRFVLTSDMGHYLADADALVGNGVRDIRHLPAFPAVDAVLRLGFSRLTTIRVGMVVIEVLLFAAGMLLFRSRATHPLSSVVGATMLAAS